MNLSYEALNTKYKHYRNIFKPFDGETKESYLEWRANWRANYKEISEDIRTLKSNRKMGDGRTDIERENATVYAKLYGHIANYVLEYRTDSKIKASQNYLKMKEVELV